MDFLSFVTGIVVGLAIGMSTALFVEWLAGPPR